MSFSDTSINSLENTDDNNSSETIMSTTKVVEACNDAPFDGVTYHLRVTLMIPLILCGLVANVINVAVFGRKSMRCSTINWYSFGKYDAFYVLFNF